MIEIFRFHEPFDLNVQEFPIDQQLEEITDKQQIVPEVLEPGKYDLTPEPLIGTTKFFLRVLPSGNGVFSFRSLNISTVFQLHAQTEGIQKTLLSDHQIYRLPEETSHVLVANCTGRNTPNIKTIYSVVQHRKG